MIKQEKEALQKKRKEQRLQAEFARIREMQTYEQQAAHSVLPRAVTADGDHILVCGIDEAGRGPFAGPVAAGAVIFPADADVLYINDSKKLSPKRREELYEIIKEKALAWNVALVGPERIDEINILQATYEAMRAAVAGLDMIPQVLVNDAVIIPGISLPQAKVIKGDAKCYSVAAASIMAKVTRDRLMMEYDRQYPQYGFAANKGYGTRDHIAALQQYGPCPIHRRTFIHHYVNN